MAVLFSSARLLLPHAENYRSEVQDQLSDYMGQPAEVAVLDAEWKGLEPQLVLKDVTLLDADAKTAVLQIQKIRLGLDLLGTMTSGSVVFRAITLVGVDLTLTRFADGRIAMQGLAPREGQQNLTGLTRWLFSQGELRLEDSNLTWLDQRAPVASRLQFADVNVGLRNVDENHWLDVSLSLPEVDGESVNLLVDLHGDPLATATGRRTRAYVSAEAVNVSRLLAAVGGLKFKGAEAGVEDADFQIWMDWLDGDLQGVQGNVDLKSIKLLAGQGEKRAQQSLQQIMGQFSWQREDAGWRFDAGDLVIDRGGKFWLPSRLSLSYLPRALPGETSSELSAESSKKMPAETARNLPAEIDFGASFIRLDLLSDLLPLVSTLLPAPETAPEDGQGGVPALLQALQALHPRGEIYDLQAHWRAGVDAGLQSYARFENLHSQAWNQVPAVSAATGQLWVQNNSLQVAVERAGLNVDLPKLFRQPLQIDYLSGQFAWQAEADTWHLQARKLRAGNQDIRSRLTLDLQKTADHPSPFISLLGHFEDGNGRNASRYLPSGLLSPKALAWLDYAIQDGHVTTGDMLFHGRLADFPYDAGNGRFEVRFDVEHARLDYVEGWPPLWDIAGEVLFKGRSLLVNADRGKILQSDIRWARAAIDDMKSPLLLLTVQGDIAGSTQDKLDYMRQSPPLNKKFGRFLQTVTAQGDSVLSLDLSLPIKKVEDTQINGSVLLDENKLFVAPLGEVLSRANGALHFSSDGLQGDALTGELLGQPVVVDVADADTAETRVHARGRFDAASLSGQYLSQVSGLVSGAAEWDVVLDVPMGGSAGTEAAVLRVTSDMVGVESRLPAPLQKDPKDQLPLELRVDFPPAQEPLLHLAYGDFLSGVFEFGEGGFIGLRRGDLRISQDAAVLPEKTGLRVSGWLDTFSLDDWGSIFGGGDGSAAAWLSSVNVTMREAQAFGQIWHNLNLMVTPQVRYWQVQIDSEEARGKLQIPHDDVQRALLANLEYCRLDSISLNGKSGVPMDPRDLPPMKLSIDELQYKHYRFGGLQLETLPVHNGLKIKRMLVTPKDTNLTVNGGWFVRAGKQYSTLDFQVESTNIEETLKAFDYLDSIGGGKGSTKFSLQWPGSPFMDDERMGSIRGSVKLDWRKGQVLDVDPGAGRLFGLMSLQTLPRRLMLDFSDVFREGFHFDRLQGDFLIEDGDAYTSNFYMTGPAARVDITGRTGLIVKDYDQLVTVTPSISDTIPILGALAIAPPVGAALLMVQKLMEPQINKATQFQYTITGPWDKPDIVKVKKPRRISEPDSFIDNE